MAAINYDIFTHKRSKEEAKAAHKLENLYHKGQNKIWNGKEVFQKLLTKHGSITLPENKKNALGNIFNIILWGELAAWKTSASLAFDINSVEAKMAATSQAHDEARHFYVMHDYLEEIGYEAGKVNPATETLLNNVINTQNLAKKLLGMQLMVEPVAITIFKFIKEANIEPVLSDLLEYYIVDESRHVALGVQYLPELIRKMSWNEKISLLVFQVKLLSLEVEGLRELSESFAELDIEPNGVFKYAEKKQLDALAMLAEELGISDTIWQHIAKVMNFQKDLAFSTELHYTVAYNITTLFRKILLGS